MPKLGWKNYWCGQYNLIDYVKKNNLYTDEITLSTRFDLFSNSLSYEECIEFVNKNKNITNISKNIFLRPYRYGVDNIYIGNINTISILISKFHFELDSILERTCNHNIINQELLVSIENDLLFT